MAFVTNAKFYLKQKFNASDTTFRADRNIGSTSGRIKFRDPNNLDSTYLEWISFSGVVDNGDGTFTYTIVTNGRNISLTAIPSTGSATGKTFGAGSEGTLVAMHDQLLDPTGLLVFALVSITNLTVTGSLKVPIFADPTARDAVIPSPSNGLECYVTSLGVYQDYTAGIWTNRGTSTTPNATSAAAGKLQVATAVDLINNTDTGSSGALLSVPPTLINTLNTQDSAAGEALTKNDNCVYEYVHASNLVAASGVGKYLQQKQGDVIGNTKISMKIVGNGVSSTTLKLGLGKVLAPVDNLVVRIETDTAGSPSGTLVNVNATSNVSGAGLTTGIIDTTVTFGGAFTLTNNTLYHVVISRSAGIDASNYYVIGAITKNVRMLKVNSYNGTVWGGESAVKTLYMIYTGAYSKYIVKAINSLTELNWFDGISSQTYAIGANVAFVREGMTTGWTGLTEGAPYYVGAVAGIPTSIQGATAREIGYAVGTTKMYIKNPLYNPSNYEYSLDNWNYYVNEGVINPGFISNTFRIQARGRMIFGMSFSGGSGNFALYVNNTIVTASSVGITTQVYPGDIVTCNFTPSVGNYARQIGVQTILPPFMHVE